MIYSFLKHIFWQKEMPNFDIAVENNLLVLLKIWLEM